MFDLWLKDKCLRELRDSIDQYSIISFDIFDTLLFRDVGKPSDIFGYVYDTYRKKINNNCCLTKEQFVKLRLLAGDRAREKKRNILKINYDPEVTIKDIYLELDKVIQEQHEIIKIEIEEEKKHLYLNPIIYNLLEYLCENNKKVILTSDMYFNNEILMDILIDCGVDIKLIDKVFVSCDYQKCKSSGKLFEEILKYYHVSSDMILHIGDSELADIEGAFIKGIKSYRYDIIVRKDDNIECESINYNMTPSRFNSLRKIISNVSKEKCDDFWFGLGVKVLGPFFTIFTEWCIDIARKNQVKQIFPLMREGVLLEKMLKQAAKYNECDFSISPLYVSRQSTYLPSVSEINNKFIENIFMNKKMRIKDLIKYLDLNSIDEVKNVDKNLKEAYLNDINEETIGLLTNIILRYKEHILKKISNDRDKIVSYFKNVINFNEKFITIDLGYRGTIQKNITNILQNSGIEFDAMHLLSIGSEELSYSLIDGIKVKCLIDYLQDSSIRLSEASIIEELMNDERGSTCAYEVKDNCVVPMLLENEIGLQEVYNKNSCQEGILFFQKMFYKVLAKKISVNNDNKLVKETFICMSRVLEYPTSEEAKRIGNMHHDENNGTTYVSTFINEQGIKLAQCNDYGAFIKAAKKDNILWPQGLAALYYPNEINKNTLLNKKNTMKYFDECSNAVLNLIENGINNVIVYGAGEVSRTLVEVLKENKIKIEIIIDRRESLNGKLISNVPIISLNNVMDYKFISNTIVIASFSFVKEIKQQIRELFNNINIVELM